MSEILCDICKTRPATAKVTVLVNGRKKVLHVCTQDLRKLQQQSASPFDRMFGGALSDNLFQDISEFGEFSSRMGYPLPRHREAVDIDQYLSAHTKELLQEAAQTALKFKRDEVDTEHLLYAISNSDVVKEIYKQLKSLATATLAQNIC
jgi:ATP-dependent Clp protease ATP-binding subunit ClpC